MIQSVFKRYISDEPSTFLIVGLMTKTVSHVIFTGEERHTLDGRIGSLEEPVDLTPFLENVPLYEL